MPPQIRLGYLRVTYHCIYRGIIPVNSSVSFSPSLKVKTKAIKKEKKEKKDSEKLEDSD